MRWLAAVAWPSMRWAQIFSMTATPCPARHATSAAGTLGLSQSNFGRTATSASSFLELPAGEVGLADQPHDLPRSWA